MPTKEIIKSNRKTASIVGMLFIIGAIAVPTFASPIISGVFLSTSGETYFAGHYVLLFWCIVFVQMALLFMRYFKEGQRI